jgi:hypothetical protein
MKTFIKNFDSNGLTIKTRDAGAEEPVGTQDKGASDIGTAAKRAAAKQIG